MVPCLHPRSLIPITGASAPIKCARFADDMNDLIARTAMLQIANDYDHMAERADERARNSKLAA